MVVTLGRSAETWIGATAPFSACSGALILTPADGVVWALPKRLVSASSTFLASKAFLDHSAARARPGFRSPAAEARPAGGAASVPLRKVRRRTGVMVLSY